VSRRLQARNIQETVNNLLLSQVLREDKNLLAFNYMQISDVGQHQSNSLRSGGEAMQKSRLLTSGRHFTVGSSDHVLHPLSICIALHI
jgi:hypothetical protein